jgi:hypothetical protein
MRRHRTIGWLAVGVALWSVGCAAPRVTRSIYQEGEAGKTETFVRLDHVDPKERFDHPAEIPPARLKELLASVAVRKRTGLLSVIFSDKPFRAFSDAQLDLLSAQLSTALAKAAPEEMALFYFNAPESNEQLRVTSGGVYVRQNKLAVVLANYRFAVSWSDQASGRPYVSVTAARDNPLYAYPEGMYQVVVGSGQERLGGEQGWFGKIFGSSDRKGGVVLALNATPSPVEAEQAGAAPAPASTPGPAAAVPPATAPAAASPLEDKLRELKKLHDEGLISDADYEAKKNELLKAF